uniref:hypothetical protein n=1 Tax=Ningiella ruwaisensis TaxID=2364274 RepID=UPI0010A06377|nr:hypothetical protein [Ningiella ruwaisensis]
MSVLKRSSPVSVLYGVLGISIIILALASFVTQLTLPELIAHAQRLFGVGFIVIYLALLTCFAFAIFKLHHQDSTTLWTETGLQAANGISTLALTFTLLGISLGIGSLSEQTLTPESVHSIIQSLTKQFSMAFMTTVVGLPTAFICRAWIGILSAKHLEKSQAQEHHAFIDWQQESKI